ncbi:DUF397 domain-containing protein [Sphaerisporangium sp. NPDC005289]|uniref:DUF397 domain-containing protein n=1 Tax=Sphaerisporangium sp. NPDC005289 TaxID=3155247 RepID=UPI0033A7AB69
MWRRSSHSGNGQNCVEVAALPSDIRGVRDSKRPEGPVLRCARPAWDAFIVGVKDGALVR